MFKLIACLSVLVVVCSGQYLRNTIGEIYDESPKPYSYGYNTADEYGTQWIRSEEADGSGAVRGTYGFRDALGIFRQVEYIADINGFRANVLSNEPGLVSSAPAAVTYNVQ